MKLIVQSNESNLIRVIMYNQIKRTVARNKYLRIKE